MIDYEKRIRNDVIHLHSRWQITRNDEFKKGNMKVTK